MNYLTRLFHGLAIIYQVGYLLSITYFASCPNDSHSLTHFTSPFSSKITQQSEVSAQYPESKFSPTEDTKQTQ